MNVRLCTLVSAAMLGLCTAGQSAPIHRPPGKQSSSHSAPPFRFDSSRFMRVSELRPGMRGYALTTFKGTTITRFNIEILGVLSKFNQGKDYILFRALDGPSVTRHLNIAHGMSGSPIYVHNRLVGAISMGIPGTQFAKEPTALATPIEEMFDVWNSHLPTSPLPISAKSGDSNGNTGLPTDYITSTGLSPRVIANLGADLKPYNLTVIAGGGGAGSASAFAKSAKLQPGSAVGISLVQGDVNVSYTGTVTYRDGNRILMFGHPLFDVGPIEAAMTTAYVVDIFPSYQDSIILGSPLTTVGRIQQDRPFSVGGVIGEMPHMIPLEVSVSDDISSRSKVMHAKIIDHPLLSSKFLVNVADQLIANIHSEPGDAMANVTLDADVEEVGHVHRSNLVYDADSIDQSAITDLSELVRTVNSNPFYPLRIRNVQLAVHIYAGHDTAEISRIFLKQKTYSPGDTVHVGVVLKPFKQPSVTKDIALVIPQNTPAGSLNISVHGGGSDSSGSSMIPGLILLRSNTSGAAATVEQLVKQFIEKPKNNDIVASIALPSNALNVHGEKLSGLPPNFAAVLQATRSTGLRTERDEIKTTTHSEYVVTGSQSLAITIQRKDALSTGTGHDAPAVSVTVPPASTASPPDSAVSTELAAAGPETADALDSNTSANTLDPQNSQIQFASASPAPATVVLPASGSKKPDKKTVVAVPPAPPLPGSVTKDPASTKAPFKIVARQNSVWQLVSAADFAPGDFQQISLGQGGGLSVAPNIDKWADTNASVIWSIAPFGDGAYVGTGNDGTVLHIDKQGKSKVFWKSGDLEVTAVAVDQVGNVYAATAPSGTLYRIGTDGKAAKWFTAPEKYITAIAMVPGTSTFYFSVGGGTGKIYNATTEKPGATKFFSTSEQHILSLALGKDGTVYAGTAPSGMVYSISPAGVSHLLTSVAESNVNCLVVQRSGDIYVGTGPQGTIYAVSPSGTLRTVAEKLPGAVTGIGQSSNGDIWATADSIIYRIRGNDIQLFSTESDEAYVALAIDSADNVLAATSTVAELYKLPAAGALSGHYDSPVRDAGRRTTWGAITWVASPVGSENLNVETRSGDTSEPDASWSHWSLPISKSGDKITSPPSRYLQMRVTISKPAGALSPTLYSMAITYLGDNRSPTAEFVSPKGGSFVNKSVTVNWTASDPDSDTLTYELSYSADDGKTWTPLSTAGSKSVVETHTTVAAIAPAAKPLPAVVSGPKMPTAAQIDALKAQLDRHPELPAAVRAQILAHAATTPILTVTRPSANGAAAPSSGAITEPTYSWDTSHIPDGIYQLKVVVSDKTSNATNALQADVISDRFTVTNKSPEIEIVATTVAGTNAVIRGTVHSGLASVANVQYKIDDGQLNAAEAVGGLFDTTNAAFIVHLTGLSKGPHKVEIETIDGAGNWSTKIVTVTI